MANYDEMSLAVKELSGGKNVVLLDDVGLPSIFVVIPKGYENVMNGGSSSIVHPAFVVDGVEKSSFYYSKYQNCVFNNRAYSLSRRDPAVYVNQDTAKKYCTNKGTGFHLSTMPEWAYIALLSRKNGTMPHGNNNYGSDISYSYERGEEAFKDGSKIGRILTGSGPATWAHDHTNAGIMDMNGNVWEWQDGLRLKDGEIQIIANNNAALGSDCDTTATSTLWKAILADGSLVEPGTSGTLKYDYVSNKIQLTSGTITPTDSSKSTDYNGITLASGLTAPEIAKALLVYPDEPSGDYGGDGHWMNNFGERLPLCGGGRGNGAGAGAFYVGLGSPRSISDPYIGFRSAFVDL